MQTAPALVAVFVAAATMAIAQQPASPTGVLAGRVVYADTGQPVNEAQVHVSLVTPTGSTASSRLPVLTRDDGRFEFRDVPPGQYFVSAERFGRRSSYGQMRPWGAAMPIAVAAGQRIDQLTIRYWRPAVVSGRVIDERGQPVTDAMVRALRLYSQALTTDGSPIARTDDRGEYRIVGVSPGSNIVCVQVVLPSGDGMDPRFNSRTPPSSLVWFAAMGGSGTVRVANVPLLAPPAVDGRAFTYVTTCAPSATTAFQARTVQVTSGQETRGVDIQMMPLRALRVSGRVEGAPTTSTHLTLGPVTERKDAPGFVNLSARAVGGTFAFPTVPAGTYLLRAASDAGNEPGFWASTVLTVEDTDVSDLVLTLRPGVTVTGRIVADDDPSPVNVRAGVVLSGPRGDVTTAPVAVPGTFSVAGLVPGEYSVKPYELGASAKEWTLATATAGGRDISDEPLTVGSTDVADIVVTLTSRQTLVSGVVSGGSVSPAEASVVVFPPDRSTWTNLRSDSRRVRAVRTGSDGRFIIHGLPPGEYFVAAADDRLMEDWPSPALLQTLAGFAMPLRLTSGESRVISLRVGGR